VRTGKDAGYSVEEGRVIAGRALPRNPVAQSMKVTLYLASGVSKLDRVERQFLDRRKVLVERFEGFEPCQ